MRKQKLYLFAGWGFVFQLFFPFQARGFEYPRYEISVKVDVEHKEIRARQVVTFTNNTSKDLQELYFHIYPNRRYTAKEKDFMLRYGGYFKVNPFPEGFKQTHLRVGSVIAEGQALQFAVEGKDETLLKIRLPKPLSAGGAIVVTMDFQVDIPHTFGRFGWHENIIKLSQWYPVLCVYNENGWSKNPFYPFHRPFFSEASYYAVDLTVPQKEVVIHTGSLVSEKPSVGNEKTLSIKTNLPVRDFTLALSPDYKVYEENFGAVKIRSFYLSPNERSARKALSFAKSLMEYYTKRFGPYPYEELSIAPVHLGYGGEQMSNLIFIDTRAYELPGFLSRYFDFLVAHETGHQWFYNLVGVDEYQQMWLEEGVNSYFILGYLKNKYGDNASILEYPEWFKDFQWLLPDLTFARTRDYRYQMIARMGWGHPIIDRLSSFQEPSSIFSLTYGKGAKVLAMLREILGEETFGKIFKRIYKEYKFANLDIKDFIRICQGESGKYLSWFFDQWLFSDGELDYAVKRVKGHTVTLENRGEIAVPAEVRVDFQDGKQQAFTWQGSKKSDEIIMRDAAAPIARVTIDPGEQLLDIDKVNNHWPRRLRIKPVPLYVGLYDMPLFLPEDSYNLVVGPEFGGGGVGVKVSLQKPFDQNFYAASDYEFGESLQHSRVGYQLKNLFQSPMSAGFEIANTIDFNGGDDDLTSGKVYLRRELAPTAYGLAEINDHATLYLIRNQRLSDSNEFLAGREDDSHLDYSRRKEAIVGMSFYRNRSGPYPDPVKGYKLEMIAENAGHFLGATQSFYRSAADLTFYQPVTPKTKLALRLKCGIGYPSDKELFFLGGWNGLRGFDRKSVRGSSGLLNSVEYRFPLMEKIRFSLFDNILNVDSVGGVLFFDAGQSWFGSFPEAKFKKDAGAGLRLTVNIGSLLEKVIVRADVAQPIDEPKAEPHFWFGLQHAF
jgi:hypothetical protein